MSELENTNVTDITTTVIAPGASDTISNPSPIVTHVVTSVSEPALIPVSSEIIVDENVVDPFSKLIEVLLANELDKSNIPSGVKLNDQESAEESNYDLISGNIFITGYSEKILSLIEDSDVKSQAQKIKNICNIELKIN